MKKIIIVLVVLVLAGVGVYFLTKSLNNKIPVENTPVTTDTTTQPANTDTTVVDNQKNAPEVVIGKSVDGNEIKAYRFGTGDTELLFVGGIHGGYEWNTVLLARELMDYLKKNPTVVPANVKVTVIPVLNPDGLKKTVGTVGDFTKADVSSNQSLVVAGRFNANEVDLNRNFDCDWQPTAKWQNKTVSGGTAAFSEPESLSIKSYVESNKPAGVVVFYSAAGGVFGSSCGDGGISTGTEDMMKVYSDASKYPAEKDFKAYAVTGDMINWLSKNNIPAMSVLLTNHTDTEWTKNWAGIEALIKHFTK